MKVILSSYRSVGFNAKKLAKYGSVCGQGGFIRMFKIFFDVYFFCCSLKSLKHCLDFKT